MSTNDATLSIYYHKKIEYVAVTETEEICIHIKLGANTAIETFELDKKAYLC